MFVARARLLSLLVAFVACAGASSCRLSPNLGKPEVTLAGQVNVDARTGDVVLRLGSPACHRNQDKMDTDGSVSVTQRDCPFDWASVRLVAPWGRTFTPSQGDEERVVFAVDWAGTGIDALESDHPEVLSRAWRFSAPDAPRTLEWIPDATTRHTMLVLIGAATGSEIEVTEVSSRPRVVVEAHFTSELRNGGDSELVVTLTNQGEGTAYRLRMTTSSNIPVLHGLRPSFGRLRPGESRTRRTRVQLPRDNHETEAIVVLASEEAHGYGPAQTSVRAKVLPAIDTAVLVLSCHFDGLQGDPPRVDAGATVHLGCEVRNDGSAAHGARMHVAYPGRKQPIDLPPFDLGGKQSTRVNIALSVPREAAIDSELDVEVSIVDDLGVSASTTVKLAIASPTLCPDGRITREQFVDKRASLRKKRDAGLISDDDYKRYEEQLIGCIQP